MRTDLGSALLIAVCCLLFAPAAAAQGSDATITVRDESTGAPIVNARVEVGGVRRPSFTDRNGVARLEAPPGNRIVWVRRLGYAPARIAVEFASGVETARSIALSAEALEVGGVSVRAARRDRGLDERGFYERHRRGFGAFMTGDEIDQIRPIRTVDLFRRIRGFKVVYPPSGTPYVTVSRGTIGLRNCRSIMLFLDGMNVASLTGPSEAMDMIPPEAIAGIEAYAGPASVPPQYNVTGSACGVVLIWTRMGDSG